MKAYLSLGILLVLLLTGCAKDNDYETVYKEAALASKNQISADNKTLFLYSPSTLGAPKDVESASPFYKGDEKIVKLKFTEKTLEIIEVEKDSRFSDNDLNNTPVLSIPVTYKDFRCTTDPITGECQNKEEENTEINWYDKNYFKPDFAALIVNEVNSLDLFNLDPGCISLVNTGLVNYEMNTEVINIELERTYKVSSSYACIANLFYGEQLSKAGFKMRFFYSLAKLKNIISPDYVPVAYPIQDQHRFGIFKTKISKLDNVYDPSRPEESYLMHRWNPKRKTITYYLSKTFNKPQNKLLKEATYKGFSQINKGLKNANVEFEIKLEEPKDDISTGDIRYSMINLLDEPLANGLLGYGPTTVNPLTGEIVQGQVNMYGGVLMTTLRSVYEAMVDLSMERMPEKLAEDKHEVDPSLKLLENTNLKSPTAIHLHDSIDKPSLKESDLKRLEYFKNKASYLEKQRSIDLNKMALSNAKIPLDTTDLSTLEDKRLTHLGKQGACSAELISTVELAKKEFPEMASIEGIRNNNGTLKAWTSLSRAKQSEIIDVILPNIYIPTLIHEMGHNLGLRHNFMGSIDKENFYTDEEAKQLGLHTTPVYSSIMDYGYSELNTLGVTFGKYDIAALRFAYAREVLNNNGEVIKIENTLLDTQASVSDLKSYQFCTDENAGLSIRCNRFDEGTTITEIALHHKKIYNDGYKYRNFRNGRTEFSDLGIAGAVSSRNNMFKSARLVYEEYEFFEGIFGNTIMEQGCTPEMLAQYPICKDINDRIEATLIVGKMFLDILKTPDLTCAVAEIANPDETSKLVKLVDIYNEKLRYALDYVPTSCFDQNIVSAFAQDNLIVRGQAGKYLNSIKDPNPIYPYITDIAVRGVWFDKLMAMKMITLRYFGKSSTEEAQGSLADIPVIKQELMNYLEHTILGVPLINPVLFITESGEKYVENYSIDSSNVIPEQPNMSVIKFLGLPSNSNVELIKQEFLTASAFAKTTDLSKKEMADAFVDSFSVYRLPPFTDSFSSKNVQSLRTEGDTFWAASKNKLAWHMISAINALDLLETLDRNLIVKVYKIKTKQFDFPDDFSIEEKKAGQLPLNILVQLRDYSLQNAPLTEEMLITQLGEERGKLVFAAFKLGSASLIKIISYIETISAIANDADEKTKALYSLSSVILEDFLNQALPTKAQHYVNTLDLLPQASQ